MIFDEECGLFNEIYRKIELKIYSRKILPIKAKTTDKVVSILVRKKLIERGLRISSSNN